MAETLNYVLITPARNEAAFIEQTIKSVVAQTTRPVKWVIVSDGSTDGTDEIVKRYANHKWIELVRMPERMERHFAGKVHAFNGGYSRLEGLEYQVIGNLDADITFGEDHFSFLLSKLTENPNLGVVGTPFQDGLNSPYNYNFVGIEHVSGCCQVFRRQCFEEIGGYIPVRDGGVDHIAVMTARMKGWQTRTFTERVCIHHREMGTAQHGMMSARFRAGLKDYVFGSHPLWECLRVLYQATRRPLLTGGLALGIGYFWALVCRRKRAITPQMVAFRQREQMGRLKNLLIGRLSTR
jgi:poly-beta-1,6-N-acetyl-D-glucosamine synthase